jgi:hypothetical protein
MASFANVYVGTAPNDNSGDPLRNAFQKINLNFANISAAGNAVAGVSSVAGRTGNVVLTVNDVAGAGSVAYLNQIVAAGNAYVDSQLANIGSTNVALINSNVSVLDANLGVATNNITVLFANAATQANGITLLTNKVNAANAAIITANTGMKSYVDSHITGTFNGGTISANLVINSHTQTNDNFTGALVLTGSGGAAVSGNVNLGGQLFVGQQAQQSTVGTALAILRGTSSSGPSQQFTQVGIINATASGSADLAAYADNGDVNGGWVDVGVAGSTFNDSAYTITRPNDGYVITNPVSNSFGGNLVLATSGTGSYNDIVFATGGFLSNNEVGRIHGDTLHMANIAYTMGNSQNWTTSVTTVGQALDQLAARLKAAGF